MGAFNEWKTKASGREANGDWQPFESEGLPLLSEALGGVYDRERRVWVGVQHTLSIWVEGSYVKFCLSAGKDRPKFFSSFQGLDAGLEEVEKCLRDQRGDWKQPGGRTDR